jgi:hypothetical protein
MKPSLPQPDGDRASVLHDVMGQGWLRPALDVRALRALSAHDTNLIG